MTVSVSVVLTVLNEAASMPAVLATLERQTRVPDEVVVVDGGSRDGTLELLQGYAGPLPLVVVSRPGANISQGRNAGIRAAGGEVVAVTDAGVRLEPQWLAALTAPFDADPPAQAVAGFFQSDPANLFEVVLGATTLPDHADIAPERFLPSSRSVAFRKEVYDRTGGYPEWLDYCEDLLFDMAVLEQGVQFAWAPQALVHFRPRPNLRSFYVQYYRYARGDGKADLWLKRHLIRYGTYVGGAVGLALAPRFPITLLLLLLGGLAYVATPARRLGRPMHGRPWWQWAPALALVPAIRLVGDVAKMVGYPVGVWWRLRGGRPRD